MSFKLGYWNINAGSGCKSCKCDPMGSVGSDCDDVSSQCGCKEGVGGKNCDACIAGYWGFSRSGCTSE
jgi:hypothetical protein